MPVWNPWHGCRRYSEGCRNCYMFWQDAQRGRNGANIAKTAAFTLPMEKNRDGSFKLNSQDYVYTCMTSDFFIEEADGWRTEAWKMMRRRSDLTFLIFTKRIVRFYNSLPPDWGNGYENVAVCVSCENQAALNSRMPLLLEVPVKAKLLALSPLLEEIDLSYPLESGQIRQVSVGGESGENARICDFDWVLSARKQCVRNGVPFFFHQTGARLRKNGKIYNIPRSIQHEQARKAGVDFMM